MKIQQKEEEQSVADKRTEKEYCQGPFIAAMF